MLLIYIHFFCAIPTDFTTPEKRNKEKNRNPPLPDSRTTTRNSRTSLRHFAPGYKIETRKNEIKKKEEGEREEGEKRRKFVGKIRAYTILRFARIGGQRAAGCGIRGGGTGTGGGLLFAYVARGAVDETVEAEEGRL